MLGKHIGGDLLCMPDIEKAYHHVNWKILIWMLERMGFGAVIRVEWRKISYISLITDYMFIYKRILNPITKNMKFSNWF